MLSHWQRPDNHSLTTWLCDLNEAKGLNMGHTYRNDKRAREFVVVNATDVRIKVSNILTTSKCASLIYDGATDKSHEEAEVLYPRTATKGVVETKYVGIKNIPKADSHGILNV